MKKALAILIAVFSIISTSLLMPFSVAAYTGDNIALTDVMIGYNIYPVQIYEDHEYSLSMSSASGTFTQTQGSITLAPFTYNNQTYYSSAQGLGQMNQSGTLSLNLSASSTANVWYKGLYRLEIILNDDYVGYMDVNVAGAGYSTLCVNGNVVSTQFVLNTQVTNSSDWSVSLAVKNVNLMLNRTAIQWNFPVESYLSIQMLYDQGFTQVGLDDDNNFLYPIFQEDSSKNIANTQLANNQKAIVVLLTSRYIYNTTQLATYFSWQDQYIGIDSFQYLNRTQAGYIFKVVFVNNDASSRYIQFKSRNSTGKFTLIYNSIASDLYPVSTDFGLLYGLNNSLLQNIALMAQGTAASNSSVSDFNNVDQSMNDTISDYNSIESQFVNDFDDNISAITPSDNSLSLMGSRFLNSANWVKTQFDRMTTGTPFGSVLGFSLVLGLGLLIIGRVFG